MPNGKILKPGRNCIALKQVDFSGILIDGRDYYRAFYQVARQARNYILISGWQFDSKVSLLRGEDLRESREDIRFLNFLNSLCEENPDLRIYILAWNFSLIFLFDREWMQKKIFSQANPRISFHFDGHHAFAASHHQKFVVVDGYAAFVGGMDICASRWDDRRHLADNPYRVDHDKPYGPYHDVNSYITGPLVDDLTGTFKRRWFNSSGERLDLPAPSHVSYIPDNETGIELAASHAAISRTKARSLARIKNPVREIRSLYKDAIRNSRSIIYMENQYFSSYSIYRALVKRMLSSEPGLQIIMMLPRREQTFVENIYVGIAQSRLLRSLKRVALKNGHSIGIYYPVVPGNGREALVFIHSKLAIVDDRFMTIGSANANNRSMGLDTELNISWEADSGQNGLSDSIKRVRVELISEHLGIEPQSLPERLAESGGLVNYLESVADSPDGRIRRHVMNKTSFTSSVLRLLRLDKIIVDPERAVIDESIIAVASPANGSFFRRMWGYLKRWLKKR